MVGRQKQNLRGENMIKLTEVKTNPAKYDPMAKERSTSYSLKAVYINPRFIISMKDNEKFNSLHKSSVIIGDLSPEAKFTRLIVASGPHGAAHYDILGAPEQNLEKLTA